MIFRKSAAVRVVAPASWGARAAAHGSGSAPAECLDRKDPEWDYGTTLSGVISG